MYMYLHAKIQQLYRTVPYHTASSMKIIKSHSLYSRKYSSTFNVWLNAIASVLRSTTVVHVHAFRCTYVPRICHLPSDVHVHVHAFKCICHLPSDVHVHVQAFRYMYVHAIKCTCHLPSDVHVQMQMYMYMSLATYMPSAVHALSDVHAIRCTWYTRATRCAWVLRKPHTVPA